MWFLVFSMAVLAVDFESRAQILKEFILEHGHSDVPHDHPIGHWFSGVRRLARRGRLSKEKRTRLVEMGATFKPLEGRWDVGLKLLTQFVEREGHAQVPKNHLEQGIFLNAWVHQQRRDDRAGRLNQNKTKALVDLGVDGISRMEKNLHALEAFRRREGHVDVPFEYIERNFGRPLRLGRWLGVMKIRAQRGTLPLSDLMRFRDIISPSRAVRVGPSRVRAQRADTWMYLANA